MNTMQQPSYITLDVEIISKDDLSALEKYLEGRTFVLGSNKIDDFYYLGFEPIYEAESTPELSAQYLAKLLTSLPYQLNQLWRNAQSKTFDFGFDSGNTGPQHQSILSPETLKVISELGASVTITVYQYEPTA